MSVVALLAVAGAGGVGAALRFFLDGAINRGREFRIPVGTMTINVTGSLLLGLLTGAAGQLDAGLVAVLGTGLMGGYTTFSTASVETVRLARAGRTTAAAVNGLGMLVVSVAAATAGVVIGRLLVP
ncbi:fluoride efflux transporter FluC [Curtobacterium sp. Leaf261]|uniref:fluoride efflux transporter FluC n=1 Tax=Curtobacterium sp. Leaf261 TaxID=1736311 RepID=UPI0006F8ED8F|nr:CrcB family protein [Curtobacterium sp. Leaf261]KQO60013.1 chromosome condensation protein CrcB [Curtobacterium sp. Leaf261]